MILFFLRLLHLLLVVTGTAGGTLATLSTTSPPVSVPLNLPIEDWGWPLNPNATQRLVDEYVGFNWALIRTNEASINPLVKSETLQCPVEPVVHAAIGGAAHIAHLLLLLQPTHAFQFRDSQSSLVDEERSAEVIDLTDIDALLSKYSLVYKPELALQDSIIDSTTERHLKELLGIKITSHTYISSPGINALKPHSDVSRRQTT
jgi:hypothetical protein